MRVDDLVSLPIGHTIHAAGAEWVKHSTGLWLPAGEEWVSPGDGVPAFSLAWHDRRYQNGERWFIRDDLGNTLAGPLDEMPTLDACALVSGGPGSRHLEEVNP